MEDELKFEKIHISELKKKIQFLEIQKDDKSSINQSDELLEKTSVEKANQVLELSYKIIDKDNLIKKQSEEVNLLKSEIIKLKENEKKMNERMNNQDFLIKEKDLEIQNITSKLISDELLLSSEKDLNNKMKILNERVTSIE